MPIIIQKVIYKIKKLGITGFILFLLQKLNPFKKFIQPYHDWEFIDYKGIFVTQISNNNYEKSINFIIPNFISNGSGGHLNIFRMAAYLEKMGYEIHISIVEDSHYKDGFSAKKIIQDYYIAKDLLPIQFKVSIGRKNIVPCKYCFATQWKTAYTLRDFQATDHKLYFIQDYEPYFYPRGSEYYLAENTYKFNFHAITAGSWISQILKKKFNYESTSVGFSYESNIYFPLNKPKNTKFRILYYARPSTPRRGFEMALLTFDELYNRNSDFEVLFAGSDISNFKIQFPYINLGNLPFSRLNDLYNSVDLGFILSFTNLSLLPYEMMASGCPVLINNGSNNEWGLNDEICFLEDTDPEKLAVKIIEIRNNPSLVEKKIRKAYEFIKKTDWKDSAITVDEVLKSKN